MTYEEAQITLRQLGGTPALELMVGAYNILFGKDSGVSFKFKGSEKANYVEILLINDLYKMKFLKLDGMETPEEVKVWDMAYADQLKTLFETTTGLSLVVPQFNIT